MRTEDARPVRLEDYRPPDWLVETVALDVSLDPNATRVRATLTLKPGSNGAAPAPLVLDGDGSCSNRSTALPAEQYVATADRLTIAQPPPPRVPARDRDGDRSANTSCKGSIVGHDLLHPMRGRGLPAHHLFSRPARRDGGLHHPHRGRESRRAGAARQRQPGRGRRRARHRPAFRGLARPVPQALLPVRAGRRDSRLRRGPLPHHVGARGDLAHLRRARQGAPLPPRHGVAQARDALGRDRVRPRIRSRYLHDRWRSPISTWGRWRTRGSTFNDKYVLARPRPRPSKRLRSHRKRSSPTNTSTIGPATASPAATGSSSA